MIKQIVSTLQDWRNNVSKEISLGTIYLFGSSINDEGLLFDSKDSDIDLVILIPDDLTNAVERTNWLNTIKKHKVDLEIGFIKLFHRVQNEKAIVSIITISRQELLSNIHKSGVRDFFFDTKFYDINRDLIVHGLISNTDIIEIDDLNRQIYEFSQAVRNKFLGVYLGQKKHPLDWNSDHEVIPKELIRTCSIVAFLENGKANKSEKTDIKIGFSHLEFYVYSKRHEHNSYLNVYNWLSKRKLRKGEQPPLSHVDYVFIAEMIFDMAQSLHTRLTGNQDISSEFLKNDEKFIIDVKESIPAQFVVSQDWLIKGTDDEIFKEIINAGINLTWETLPYFQIILEEKYILEEKIKADKKDGRSIEKLRILNLTHADLVKGFTYIIYYQKYFFYGSKNTVSDILLSLRNYCKLRNTNYTINDLFEIDEYPLEAYHLDTYSISTEFPSILFNSVINFGLPNEEVNLYFSSHKDFKNEEDASRIMTLAANNQLLTSVSSKLLAQYFVPELTDKLVNSNATPLSKNEEVYRFNQKITNVHLWKFGVH